MKVLIKTLSGEPFCCQIFCIYL